MKVLGLVGSPRKNGNTVRIVHEVLKGAATKGAETPQLFINDYKINPC